MKKFLYFSLYYSCWHNTPLHISSSSGHLSVVEALAKKSANINAQNSIYSFYNAQFHKMLLNNGFWYDKFVQETPLDLASSSGHLSVVKFLATNGADINIKS